MSQESLGYIKLEWNCPQCGGRNPGPQKTCVSCGAPQPDDVEFVQPAGAEIITDESEIAQAKAGPDIHCAFCGARNQDGAKQCSQCGADLSEGAKREAGQVLGAYQPGQVIEAPCPNCGQMNPENQLRCIYCGASTKSWPAPAPSDAATPTGPAIQKGMSPLARFALFGVIGLVLICIIGFVLLSFRTEAATGIVERVAWQSIILIESLQPVTYQAWWDEIPAEATPGACISKVRYVQDEPAPNANEICGTPYTKDTGSGFAEVVQDCRYEILEDYCDYTVMEWREADQASLSGDDFSPVWPQPQLENGQRLGEQRQSFTIYLQNDEGQETYSLSDPEMFRRFQIGSEWTLNINSFGAVMSVEPAP